MKVSFYWSRIMQPRGNEAKLGTLLVLNSPDGPYLQMQCEDDHYDGVIEARQVAELLATLQHLSRNPPCAPGEHVVNPKNVNYCMRCNTELGPLWGFPSVSRKPPAPGS